jgi:hypothetical protein
VLNTRASFVSGLCMSLTLCICLVQFSQMNLHYIPIQHWFVLAMELNCVLCEVGTEFLNSFHMKFMLHKPLCGLGRCGYKGPIVVPLTMHLCEPAYVSCGLRIWLKWYVQQITRVRCYTELRISWKYFIMMRTRKGLPVETKTPTWRRWRGEIIYRMVQKSVNRVS